MTNGNSLNNELILMELICVVYDLRICVKKYNPSQHYFKGIHSRKIISCVGWVYKLQLNNMHFFLLL